MFTGKAKNYGSHGTKWRHVSSPALSEFTMPEATHLAEFHLPKYVSSRLESMNLNAPSREMINEYILDRMESAYLSEKEHSVQHCIVLTECVDLITKHRKQGAKKDVGAPSSDRIGFEIFIEGLICHPEYRVTQELMNGTARSDWGRALIDLNSPDRVIGSWLWSRGFKYQPTFDFNFSDGDVTGANIILEKYFPEELSSSSVIPNVDVVAGDLQELGVLLMRRTSNGRSLIRKLIDEEII